MHDAAEESYDDNKSALGRSGRHPDGSRQRRKGRRLPPRIDGMSGAGISRNAVQATCVRLLINSSVLHTLTRLCCSLPRHTWCKAAEARLQL